MHDYFETSCARGVHFLLDYFLPSSCSTCRCLTQDGATTMRTRSQTYATRKTLLDLPPEIFTVLEAYLEIRELASFILTCSIIKQRLERFLYKKVIITPESSNTNTRHFVSLLNQRPEIVYWINKFKIDEYDVEYLPQLLAFNFPNLLNLILQHEGPVNLPSCGRRKLNALYAMIKPQPALQNLTFNIELKVGVPPLNHEPYYLPASKSPLFRHPNLVRMRLSHLGFMAFNRVPQDYLCHANLSELVLERCRYSAQNLQLLLNPCQRLEKLWLPQTPYPLFPQRRLVSILHPVKNTLRVLKSSWGHLAPIPAENMDLRDFPNLHSIIMHPQLLFGERYKVLQGYELSMLIKSTLPPNLVILTLEGVVAVGPDIIIEPSRLPMPDQWVQHFQIEEGEFRVEQGRQPIPDQDLNLMRHLLENKDEVAPELEWLTVQYLQRMQNIPKDIIDLAKMKNVRCCELYDYDEIAPPLDMSKHVPGKFFDNENTSGEERGKGASCTWLNHSK